MTGVSLGPNREQHERGRVWSRLVAWLTVPIYLAGIAITRLLEHRTPGFRAEEGVVETLGLIGGFAGMAGVGALLVGKRPRNPIGWILTAVGLMIGAGIPLGAYTGYVMATRGAPDALAIAGAWFQAWYWYLLLSLVFVFLPLYFPDGRLPSPRFKPVAIVAGTGTVLIVLLAALTEMLSDSARGFSFDNPIGIEGLAYVEELPFFGLLGLPLGVGMIGALVSVAVRFRRSRGVERQQVKWLLFPVAFFPLVIILDVIPGEIASTVSSILFVILVLALPVAIAVAVLRYRLYEIDRIISRTVTYGVMVILLAAIYSAGVFVVQTILPGQPGDLAVAASTLGAAALFSPLRRSVQASVNRRFNRGRYDAERVIADFSRRLRASFDLTEVASDLRLVMAQTVQPATASVWLRSESR